MSDDFDRCLRLRKICEPSGSVRRRNVQTAPDDASDTRIARLEDKMESLLTAMSSFIASPGASGPSVNILQSLDGHSSSSSASHSNSALLTSNGTTLGFNDGSAFPKHPSSAASPESNALFLPHHYLLSPNVSSPNHEDEQINFFRSRMLPSFPFINLTPDMTSWYLRQSRPVLYQAIQTVTTFSTQERLTHVEVLKHLVFTSAFLKVQSNIDLLLGILTYLAWSTDAFLGRADLVSRLMMLAISLLYDLRLFKPSSPDVQLLMAITQGREENSQNPCDVAPYDLLERQRAILACFILSSKCA